jgi:hypothetical protein
MADETPIRFGGEADSGNAPGERAREQSPLQGRAAFIKNWDWQFIISLNRGSCERGKAQHGNNPRTHEGVRKRWEERRVRELSLGETLDFLLECHRSAPFFFFNGNTFSEIARRIVDAVFIEFPLARRREASSLAAHYVAGVLDRNSMVAGLDALAELAEFKIGDRVKTLRGSASGVVVRITEDGRIAWRAEGSESEFLTLPESLLIERRHPCE